MSIYYFSIGHTFLSVISTLCRSITLRPDITFEGLYNMLAAIERELPTSTVVPEIYQTQVPVDSVRKEIMEYVMSSCSLYCSA